MFDCVRASHIEEATVSREINENKKLSARKLTLIADQLSSDRLNSFEFELNFDSTNQERAKFGFFDDFFFVELSFKAQVAHNDRSKSRIYDILVKL